MQKQNQPFRAFRIKFSYEDKTRYDYWERVSFNLREWQEISDHCKEAKLDFISSPFSIKAVNLLEKVNVQKYKIGSGEVSNHLLLEKVARTKKPILISSGMSNYDELDGAIKVIKEFNNDISIFQCTSQYPVNLKHVGLNVINELQTKYNYPIGLSDHSAKPSTSIAACALGAQIFEVHVVFDRRAFGPDSTSSLTIQELKDLVISLKDVTKIMSNPVNKNNIKKSSDIRNIFGKSLAVNRDLKKELKYLNRI